MLKKKERLSRQDFSKLMRDGKRYHTEYFTLLWRITTSEMKCGVVVSKKTAKKAVQRNKLRRNIYRVFFENKNIIQGKHFAILTKHSIQHLSKSELQKEITEALKKTEA